MMQRRLQVFLRVLACSAGAVGSSAEEFPIREYPVPADSHPREVAGAPDGSVHYACLARRETIP